MTTENETKQETTTPDADAMQELSASTVGSVMSIYATMIHGQIVNNDAIPYPYKLAAVLAAKDVLDQVHIQTFNAIRQSPNDGPAWALSPDKARGIAELYARYMVQGK